MVNLDYEDFFCNHEQRPGTFRERTNLWADYHVFKERLQDAPNGNVTSTPYTRRQYREDVAKWRAAKRQVKQVLG